MSDTTVVSGFQELQAAIGDFGRDIRVNLENVLGADGAPGLTPVQQWSVALASAYATQQPAIIAALSSAAQSQLTPEAITAAKSAATIMAMNNVYYRFTHLAEEPTFAALPARLRMMVIGKPGVPKVDFELMSLAVSAINGCGMCIKAHVAEIRKGGVTDEGIQSSVRIAAVINGAKQAVAIQA